MKKKNLVLLFFILILFNVNHVRADGYLVSSIPENLKKDAYAVIRESSKSFVQQDMQSGVYKVTYVITILDEKGRNYADFFTYEDSFSELKSFSGEIINAAGKTIKKIGKKDLTTTALSSELASNINNKRTFYECYAPAYPFTVKYEYEMKFKNGILLYPPFAPVRNFNVSLEKSDYLLQIPKDVNLRYKAQVSAPEPEKSILNNDSIFKWTLNNFESLSYERFAPSDELFPIVFLAPSEFCIQNYCGDMSTWENFGKWNQKLLLGRDKLPQKTIDKIKELTNGISDNREKVKLIYEYLQSSTHYVSIQLGVGGWQPMPAEDVAKTGFGDCKALSNYMKAMLKVVDIPSYYISISMNKKRFFKDYPNFSQADHVILMVPMEKDSIWLECTSQLLPFGYIHSRIAGHDALAVGDDQSFFCTLPSYSQSEIKESNNISIQLDGNGTAGMKVQINRKLEEYENILFGLNGLNNKEENDFLAGLLKVHKPKISDFRKEEIRSEYPEMNLYFSVSCEDYASQTGSRMFIPVDPARYGMKGFLTGSTRKFDILLQSGMFQSDTVSIQIPTDYVLEQKPKTGEITSEYGTFKSAIVQDGNMLKYTQTLEVKPGRYPANQFEDIKKFFNQIDILQEGKIGFKK
ncbi:MAG: DUF3857 domain-containing transglutaminase family protein [Candidatus Azobacteroides sp.]|nr:DUF3857 domain-containing transglutaminase family protein [Candidatus Azobacteroides sp.]